MEQIKLNNMQNYLTQLMKPKTAKQKKAFQIKQYEEIIATTKCPKHKALCKSVLKEIIKPKKV